MGYWTRFWPHFGNSLKKAIGEQVIGALLTIAILVYQIHYGLIEHAQERRAYWAIAWPYLILVGGLLVWRFIKTPEEMDAELGKSLGEATEREEHLKTQIAEMEKRYFDQRPRLGMRVTNTTGFDNWRDLTSGSLIKFYIWHLSGRPATSITFDSISSLRNDYTLFFQGLPYVTNSPEQEIDYEVWKNGERPSRKVIQLIGLRKLFGEFIFDGRGLGGTYPITLRFMDGGEMRSQRFKLLYDATNYRLSIEEEAEIVVPQNLLFFS